jgi:glucan phosphoethanolaminetransferase (alkaline phosphatase superfamily)
LRELSETATKVVSLQTDLFVLKQELKTLRQIKRILWLGVAFILFNLLLVSVVFWTEMGLYEQGWSPLNLALCCFIFFGVLIFIAVWMAIYVGSNPKTGKTLS